MNIDAHQHFWKYDPVEYPWIRDHMAVLRRDYMPEDLVREQSGTGFDGAIAVQARQSLTETRWLLQLADAYPVIQGVVGWVDLRANQVSAQLEEFAAHSRFVGVRHVVQDEADSRFILGTDFLRGIETLAGFNLVYDLLVFPKQLPAAIELAKRFPEQRFVLDHIAKPLIRAGVVGPWAENIRALAACSNVYCKISGLVTEADWSRWSQDDFVTYLDVVWRAFGEDRLMVGSDWPVCLLAGSYQQVMDIPRRYLESQPEAVQKKVFGDNAVRCYIRR